MSQGKNTQRFQAISPPKCILESPGKVRRAPEFALDCNVKVD